MEEPMINSFLSLSLQERYVINYRVTKDIKIWRRQEVYQDLWSEVVRRRGGAWHMNVLKRERAYLLFLLMGSEQRTCVSVWLRWRSEDTSRTAMACRQFLLLFFLFMLKSFPKSKVLDGFMKIPCCFLFWNYMNIIYVVMWIWVLDPPISILWIYGR